MRDRRPPPPRRARDRAEVRQHPFRVSLGGRLRPLLLGLVLAGVLLLGLAGLVALRATSALTTIQQKDPRLRPPASDQLAAILPSSPSRDSPVLQPTAATNGTFGAPLQPTRPPLPNTLRDPFNVLLIGVDKRPDPNESVRSDTLILVHVDPQAKWVAMLSIPRDSVVNIPYLGWSKINAAFASGYTSAAQIYGEGTTPDAGGAALAAEAVEAFLGVRVDYTAQVDFHGFAALVDSVGGVVVDVPRPLLDAEYPTDDYGVERVYIPAGLQVLDGRAALIYARSRHLSTDFDRGRRQQMVLRALLDQVRTRGLLENVTTLPAWAEMLEQNVRTTLPLGDLGTISGLATLARELRPDRVVQLSLNPNDVAIDMLDGSDIYWNKADIAALIARWQAGPQTPAAAEGGRIQVLNGAAVDGIAGRVSTFLRGKGFTVADPDQAPQVYAHTTIIDYAGRPEARRRLADTLGIDPRYIQAIPESDSPPRAPQVDLVVVVGADYRQEWAVE